MRLHSVKLQNIRSYLSETIAFPEGMTLLAGDIGSGKSTVLLAIEFGLFGIKRGELAGGSLLRHGKREGSVELVFSVGGKEYCVRRTLKRLKDGVKQDSGHLSTNGTLKEGTPVELRAWILEILGYPSEVLEKGKDLIYRYTVYTPQEEMKRILTENPEIRLDTLRRVFGIDRYKRIRENAQVIIRDLRERTAGLEGRAATIGQNKNEREGLDKEMILAGERIAQREKSHTIVAKELTAKEASLENIQKELSILQKARTEFEKRATEIFGSERLSQQLTTEISRIKKLIVPVELPKEKLPDETSLRDEIKRIDSEHHAIEKKIGALLEKERSSRSIITAILDLQNCPTCLQPVTDGYHGEVIEREEKASQIVKKECEGLLAEHQRIKNLQTAQEKIYDDARRKRQDYELLVVKDRQNKGWLEQISQKKQQLSELSVRMASLRSHQDESGKELAAVQEKETSYSQVTRETAEARRREHAEAIALAQERTTAEGMKIRKGSLDREIAAQEEALGKAADLRATMHWLSDGFSNLMSTMERHVMARIQQEFSALFSEWFNVLVEDEALAVALDDNFSPVVSQDGYEAEVEDLSGGERTSLALAYRLSLTKVINDVIEGIKTRDLLILDEPTEGFSTEQLDRVREVLDRIDLRQVVIVSHENKIESFVDSVLRIQKDGHVSKVVLPGI